MADGNAATVAKRPTGRPKKARGAATSSDDAEARWSIRGVPPNVRSMALKAATKRGLTVGDLISEAVVAYIRSDGKRLSADGGSGVPALPLAEELATALSDIQNRLAKVEADRAKPIWKQLFGGRA